MRQGAAVAHDQRMTNTQIIQTAATPDTAPRPSRRRRRVIAALFGIGVVGATFGISTSPGRIGGSTGQVHVAIPGVRGTGGGTGGTSATSTSRSGYALALRKAGGHNPEFF